MKRKLAVLVVVITMILTLTVTSFANELSTDRAVDMVNVNEPINMDEWQAWFDSLSQEKQLAVNYEPNNDLNTTTLSEYEQEWILWFNSLSEELQNAVNYIPRLIIQLAHDDKLGEIKIDKVESVASLESDEFFKLEDEMIPLTIEVAKNALAEFDKSQIWKTLEVYEHIDIGSGIYIWKFNIQDKYILTLTGRSLKRSPDKIELESLI